jgi:hypothetical protein
MLLTGNAGIPAGQVKTMRLFCRQGCQRSQCGNCLIPTSGYLIYRLFLQPPRQLPLKGLLDIKPGSCYYHGVKWNAFRVVL